MKFNSKYIVITAEDLTAFSSREIVYNSTKSSTLGSENAILTLVNTQPFEDAKELFFKRLNSGKFKDYGTAEKITFFLKWVIQFIRVNERKLKEVNYLYTKTVLDDLKEASILMYNEAITEQENA